MNKNDILYFKEKLLKEKALLESELANIGKVNPNNPNDWSATTNDIETDSADENEVADRFEELEENEVVISKLEPQYLEVKNALDRIETLKYGICEVSGEEIERDRLEANPSARTCKAHMGK
ncbi:MAG: TraR/DksA C4-type zinc finger protein [Patescibacteria group bacterium]